MEGYSSLRAESTRNTMKTGSLPGTMPLTPRGDEDAREFVDEVRLDPESLDEDTYCMTVCALVRDTHFLSKGDGMWGIRTCRLLTTFALLFVTIGLQVYVLINVKTYVSARAVKEIRGSYSLYEKTIYGEENCTFTKNGNHRGISEKFPGLDVAKARLQGLKEEEKLDICRIPLSQPHFTFIILFVWTTTILDDVRRNTFLFMCLIVGTQNTQTMRDALHREEDAGKSHVKERVVWKLTIPMKILLTFLIFVPRWCIAIYLWWLGSRWLLATNSFQDLILNALALEFILLIKEGLYIALMPHRNKVDLANTKIYPFPEKLVMDVFDVKAYWELVQVLLHIGFVVLAVVGYMIWFQRVLPQYNWDVHDVCSNFIHETYHVGL